MMVTLTLPQLVAGRRLAAGAVARLGAITGVDVTVDATPLVSGTSSFAGQLVESVLVEGGAAHLTVLGGPTDFVTDVRAAVDALDVRDRVTFTAPEEIVLI
jgi:hypothetical protein